MMTNSDGGTITVGGFAEVARGFVVLVEEERADLGIAQSLEVGGVFKMIEVVAVGRETELGGAGSGDGMLEDGAGLVGELDLEINAAGIAAIGKESAIRRGKVGKEIVLVMGGTVEVDGLVTDFGIHG